MAKKSITIENLLDALEEHDKEKYSIYNGFKPKPDVNPKHCFTKDELNLINKHYGEKFWCECCSSYELSKLLGRHIGCSGCTCCVE